MILWFLLIAVQASSGRGTRLGLTELRGLGAQQSARGGEGRATVVAEKGMLQRGGGEGRSVATQVRDGVRQQEGRSVAEQGAREAATKQSVTATGQGA